MRERSVKTNMFENFIKQDVDDMIFGSTKQIIQTAAVARTTVAVLALSDGLWYNNSIKF